MSIELPLPVATGPDLYFEHRLWSTPVRWRYRPEPEPQPEGFWEDPVVRFVVAALWGWKHMTTDHLARFGVATHKELEVVLPKMWWAGLVDRGSFDTPGLKSPALWRLVHSDLLNTWLGGLDTNYWLSVTAARKPDKPRPHIRHDLLAIELGLRVAETRIGFPAIYPELLSGVVDLFPNAKGSARGDLTLVRSDGLRVVVEITAKLNETFKAKLVRWGRTIMAHEQDATVVLFVICPPAGTPKFVPGAIRNAIRATLTPEVLGQDGAWATNAEVTRVRRAFAVVEWMDWFPAPSKATKDFLDLTAKFYTAKGVWADVGLARQYPFKPQVPDHWRWAVRNSARLLACPAPLATVGPKVATQ